VTKAKGLQGCGPRGSPRVTPHALGNAKECEGMNTLPKEFNFGSWNLGGLLNFQRAISGVKTQ